MRRKTLLTAVIIAVALVGCNKAGAEVPPTTEEKLASTSIEETSYTKTVEEITSTEKVATTTTIAPTEPTIMKETTSTGEEVATIEEKTTSTKEVTSTEIETTTVAPTETSGEGIIEAETSTKEPEKTTTVAQTETTVVATTTVAPTTTEAPTTTVAPVTTEAPHSHNYTSTVTKTATCTEEGIVTYACSCGSSYTESVPTLSHSFGEYVYNNDATTENDGTKTATCSVCGTSDTIVAEGTKVEGTTYPPLPTESCPYPVNTIIDNGDGTYSMYYVDTGLTMDKYGISDGFVGNNAGNDFQTFCNKNYLDVAFDCYIGDYAEGCISWICGQPRSF